jgi:hypothetical protein
MQLYTQYQHACVIESCAVSFTLLLLLLLLLLRHKCKDSHAHVPMQTAVSHSFDDNLDHMYLHRVQHHRYNTHNAVVLSLDIAIQAMYYH